MKTHEQTIPVKVDEIKLGYQTSTPASQRAKETCSDDAKNAFLDTWEEEPPNITNHSGFYCLTGLSGP